MSEDLIPIMGDFTLILLLIAIGIFGSLAIQSRSLKSFQFHISIIVIIWIVAEVIDISNDMGIIEFQSLSHFIHLAAMVLIGITFWLRFYYAKRSGRKIVEDIYD
ncbi:MAG: hypothetical protein ACE5DT_05255 [Nitrosopumilus sp.]